ncbi:MAG: glutathione S-transferase family protein [Burkholderiaceae bacterium]|nr:glutathione S-transferase family protein [Burkholderiaceae bacterium]
MLLLYHCENARSFRPLWTLEEMELTYRLELLPFPPRVHRRRYLEVNPLGTVPCFFDGSMRMTESAAICQYLVTRYGPTPLNVGLDETDYGRFLNWLHFGEATLTFPQTLVLRYGSLEPTERRVPQVVDDYTRWFLARLRGIEEALSDRPYLCAGRFTAADISVGYALMLAEILGLHTRFPASIARYWERLAARPGFARALGRQKTVDERAGFPSRTQAPVRPGS